MADPNKDTDNFVELDGVKYKEDPENEGQALLGEDNKLVPFEEKKAEETPEETPETPEETEEEKKVREKKELEEEEKKDPPLRKSAKDHIIQRQQRKIKKEKEKKEETPETPETPGEETVTPEGQTAIKKEVDKAIKPVLQSIRTTADEQELANVFAKYPMAKKMEKQIRKYMEVYPNPSVEFIFLGLASKKMDLQKKRDKADDDAKTDITGGQPTRKKKDTGPIPDVHGWSDKQITELQHKIATGQV